MSKLTPSPTPNADKIADDVIGMDEYLRGARDREAIDRGLSDIREGRVLIGEQALHAELSRRMAGRRDER